MKKIIFLAVLAMLAISRVQAQLRPDIERSKTKRTTETKTVPPPAPPPPPAPVAKTSVQDVPVYALTSVRVKIRTGSDNKEFPSKVYATLMARSTPKNWRNYNQFNLSNEMKINADTEFGMQLEGPPTPLQDFQSAGLKLALSYEPNFFADAWKIESISLILEFKDQNGNLHPSLGNKTIVFSNAYGFLNNEYRYIDCFTDGSFAPITSVIRK